MELSELTKPFFEPGCFVPQEEAVNAVLLLHESGGVEQISMSAVARHIGCSRAAVHQAHRSKAEFIVSLVARFAYRWRDWTGDVFGLSVPIRLARNELERLGMQTWASLRCIAAAEARAGRPDAWSAVRHSEDLDRRRLADQIRSASGHRPADGDLDATLALADGLRAAMSRPVDPLPVDRAVRALSDHWTRHLGLPLLRDPLLD